MSFHRFSIALLLLLAAGYACGAEEVEKWDRDVGMPAPQLVAAGWIGTPVSLDELKGNTIVLAFWNADVAWC